MDNLLADYLKLRAKGTPARWALKDARERVSGLTFQWSVTTSGERGTCTRDGFELVAKVKPDDFADLSYLGEWTETWSPDVVVVPRELRYAPAAFQVDYRYFQPAISWREHRDGLSKLGYSKHQADCLAREYNLRDLRALLETYSYFLVVTASKEGVELGSSSCGGIGFLPDTSETDRETYLDELAADLMGDAISEARATLHRLTEGYVSV